MNLARQTWIIIGVMLVPMLAALHLTSQFLTLRSFHQLEQREINDDMGRTQRAMEYDLHTLEQLNGDWAFWDDMHAFARGAKPEFVAENFTAVTFERQELNIVLLLDPQGRVIAESCYDLEAHTPMALPPELLPTLLATPGLLELKTPDDLVSGYFPVGEHPAMLAVRPVLTSDEQGPPVGILVMGKVLNTRYLERLEKRTALEIRFAPLGEAESRDATGNAAATTTPAPATAGTPDPAGAAAREARLRGPRQTVRDHLILEPDGQVVVPVDDQTILGASVLRGLDDSPVAFMEIRHSRDTYSQGLAVSRTYQRLLVVYGAIFGLMLVLLLRVRVLAPIDRICRQVRAIAVSAAPEARVQAGERSDEIGGLARDLNDMLASLALARATAARQESEKAMLLDAMDVQVWYLTSPDTCGLVNRACADFLGRDIKELEDQPVTAVWPDDAAAFAELRRDVFQTGIAATGEHAFTNGRGQRRALSLSLKPHLNDRDEVEYVVCTASDIDTRKRAEQALRESEERLNLALRSSAVGTWSWDLDHDTMVWDRYLEGLFGLEPGCFDGRFESFRAFIHPEDRDSTEQMTRTRLQETGSIEFEFRIVDARGRPRTMYSRGELVRDARAKTVRAYGVCLDITDRVQAEQALRASEETFRSLVEQMPEHLALLDTHGQIRFLNREPSPDMTSDGPHDPASVPRHFADLVHESWRPGLRQAMQRVVDTRHRQICEARLELYGHPCWWSIRLGPILDGQTVTGIVAIGTDITERKHAEDELRRLTHARVSMSECSLALVRSRSEPELLDQVCSALTQVGERMVAWIGYDDAGPHAAGAAGAGPDRFRLRPQAVAGDDAGLLPRLAAAAPDPHIESGSAIIALQRRQTVRLSDLCRTAESDPAVHAAAMAELALINSLGFHDAAVFPLIIDDVVIGAVQLFSRTAQTFGTNEIKLLQELTGDLAYGVQTLRARAEHRRAEIALHDSELRYRTLAEYCPVGIWHIRLDGSTIYANPAMLDLLDLSTIDELTSRDYKGFFTADGLAIIARHHSRRQEGVTSTYEVEMVTATGQQRLVAISGAPFVDDDGTLQSLIGSFIDITERRKAETQNQRLEEKLHHSQKMESIGRLAGGIAHDFNNLLAAIVGYAELLRMERADDPGIGEFINPITTAAEDASTLIRQLLTFSHKTRHQAEPVQINTVITETIGLLSRTLDRKISITRNLQVEHSLVLGDPALLRSALLNMGINAGDAMPEGGELTFATRVVDSNTAMAYARNADLLPGIYLEVRISDTGIGMSQDVQDRVFEPFFTTKAPGKGTGLGLATVYGTIKSHGGALGVESKVGQGSTFRIYLPLRSPPPGDAGTAPPRPAPPRGTGHILLVDDEQMIRHFCQRSLEKLGYTVTLAENGEVGVRLFREQAETIDLVVLDMIMPAMNGRDAFHAMRQHRPGVRAIMVTGFSLGIHQDEFLDDGFLAVLHKPISVHDLAHCVAQFLIPRPGLLPPGATRDAGDTTDSAGNNATPLA